MRAPAAPAPSSAPAVTLFGRDGCGRAAELRALLGAHAVPFAYVALDGEPPPDDPCGHVSPSLQIARDGRVPDLLIQPSPAETLDALRHARLVGAPRRSRSLPASSPVLPS